MIDLLRVMRFSVISLLFGICIFIQISKVHSIHNSPDVNNINNTVNRECQLVEDCEFYHWFIYNGTYRIPGFPKEIIEAFLRRDQCGLDQEGNVVKVNCPIGLLNTEDRNVATTDWNETRKNETEGFLGPGILDPKRLTECEKLDAVGLIKIVHASTNDITDTGLIVLTNEKRLKQKDFPNLKSGYPILKERRIIYIQATGLCFCWKFYDDPQYRGETQLIYAGDRYIPETDSGSLMRVLCPLQDD